MTRALALKHEFVEFIPQAIEEGMLYISTTYGTVVHKCCCGCGREVVTPLTPTDWSLIFDGETISLHPSVGNWSFECRSHYIIRRNKVQWAGQWSNAMIDAGRARDLRNKSEYFSEENDVPGSIVDKNVKIRSESFRSKVWSKLKNWFATS